MGTGKLKSCRLHITLIEILIVVVILTMVTGAVGVNIVSALREQRFRTEAQLMIDTLRLAQDLMLVMGRDVYVKIRSSPGSNSIEYFLDIEGEIPEKWKAIVKKNDRILKETHHVSLEPHSGGEGELVLQFLSDGSVMTKGVFRMSTHENENTPGALTMQVCLKGYPHPIVGTFQTVESVECENLPEDELNQKLTRVTVREILEDTELAKAKGEKDGD